MGMVVGVGFGIEGMTAESDLHYNASWDLSNNISNADHLLMFPHTPTTCRGFLMKNRCTPDG